MGWRTFGSRMVACKLCKILTRTDPGKDDVGPRHITASSTFWHFFFLIFQTSHLLVESWKPLEGSYNQTCTGFFKFWSPPSQPQGVYHSRYFELLGISRVTAFASIVFRIPFSDMLEEWKRPGRDENTTEYSYSMMQHCDTIQIQEKSATCVWHVAPTWMRMNIKDGMAWYGRVLSSV